MTAKKRQQQQPPCTQLPEPLPHVIASMEQPLLTVPQVAEILNISRAMAYKLIDTGQLPVIRIGISLRVCHHALNTFLAEKEHEAGKE